MEKLNLKIKDYIYKKVEDHYRFGLVSFAKKNEEEESLCLKFHNGSRSTNFLLHVFGTVDYWQEAFDVWQGKEIGIAFCDEKPIALIREKNQEICFLQNEDLEDSLLEKYGVTKKNFRQKVKKELKETSLRKGA